MVEALYVEARVWLFEAGHIDRKEAFRMFPAEVRKTVERTYDGGWKGFRGDNSALFLEIGERTNVEESAGGQVVYAKEWTRVINGKTFWFSYVIPTGRTAFVRVYRYEEERLRSMHDVTPVHDFRWRARVLPGLVTFSEDLGKLFGF